MWQKYILASSIDEVLQVLSRCKERARIIAGGTDLILELERGVRTCEIAVDVSTIPGLDQIRRDGKGFIHIGPMVTHNQLVNSEICREYLFPLANAAWQIGAPQIRNRGTIAGNLITGSPANDTITPLWAMDARIQLKSLRGERTLRFDEFFLGVRRNALAADEMLSGVIVPETTPRQRGVFLKLGLRQAQAISLVNVCVLLTFEAKKGEALNNGKVTQARITLGSVSPTIIRAINAENSLEGKSLSADNINTAARLAADAAKPIDDVRGSAGYRRYMIEVLTRRALETLAAGNERSGMPAKPVMLWGKTHGYFPTSRNNKKAFDMSGSDVIEVMVNGSPYRVEGASHKTLLRMLREDIGLTGTKEGCAEGECGACTILLDGIAVMSCLVPAPRAHGCEIITVEGLSKNSELHPLQQAFIEENAAQCGYCTPGFLMSGASLMEEVPNPDKEQIRQAIAGNLCRCTGYYSILSAIEKAAGGEK